MGLVLDRETKEALDTLRKRHETSCSRADRLIKDTEAISQALREAIEAYRKGDEVLSERHRRSD